MRLKVLAACLCVSPAFAFGADVGQDAIDGCIDQLRAVGGPDGQGGTVLSTEFSEANSLVMLKDRGETVWRCLVSNDGQVAELSITQAADDGEGAMAGAEPEFWQVNVSSSLNVRVDPSASSPAFFKLPNGSTVRNLGCQDNEGRRWCMVPTGPNDGASIGWVAAEFLVPASPLPAGTNARIPATNAGVSADSIEAICRSTALREFGRDDLVELQAQTARVDGVVPVNGQFSNGWRFQCEFSASGELTSFRATN